MIMNEEENLESAPILQKQDAVSQIITFKFIFAVLTVVLGSSFQFGYNTGVINAPETILEHFINESYEQRHGNYLENSEINLLWAVIVSIFAIGGMFGSFAAGYMAERFGRKKALFLNNFIILVGVVAIAITKVANMYEWLIVGRFIIGFNCGVNTGLAPLYLTEIAPINLRGTLGSLNQMGVVTSMLLSQVLGLPQALGNAHLWPVLFCFTGIFAIFQLLSLPFCPETPAYLMKLSHEADARASLQWLRGRCDVENELRDIRLQVESSSQQPKVGIKALFSVRHLLKPMIVAIVMQCSQQLSGVNAVFYYSTNIFISAGLTVTSGAYITVGIGCINVIMSGISTILVEKAGRRVLHLVGLGGMFVCAVILVFSLSVSSMVSSLTIVSVIATVVFVLFFQVGPASIPWFITAELFKENARAAAISVAGLVNWFCNFVVGLSYPPLQNLIHGYTFIIFACLILAFWIFTYYKVPETKGKSINEISQWFQDNSIATTSS